MGSKVNETFTGEKLVYTCMCGMRLHTCSVYVYDLHVECVYMRHPCSCGVLMMQQGTERERGKEREVMTSSY